MIRSRRYRGAGLLSLTVSASWEGKFYSNCQTHTDFGAFYTRSDQMKGKGFADFAGPANFNRGKANKSSQPVGNPGCQINRHALAKAFAIFPHSFPSGSETRFGLASI